MVAIPAPTPSARQITLLAMIAGTFAPEAAIVFPPRSTADGRRHNLLMMHDPTVTGRMGKIN